MRAALAVGMISRMGVFDLVSRGLDAASKGTQRLIESAFWNAVRGRAGDVVDSRRGTVQWVPVEADYAFDVVAPGLPVTRVWLRLREVHASIGPHQIGLTIGKRALRRVTFSASAAAAGHAYFLRQTGRRRAVFERDGTALAALSRPRRATRLVDWGTASVDDVEIALAHALAVYAGIGAPGVVANTIGNIGP